MFNAFGSTATITHSTVSGNTADDGGGVFNYYGTLRLEHTLISGNTASRGAEVQNGYFIFSDNAYLGTLYANNDNLFGHSGLTNAQAFVNFTPGITDINATSGYLAIPLGDILQVDGTGTPALQDNGGPTKTIALVAGSPAIDAVTDGSCPPPETDQRGVARPIDGDRGGTAECDIGVFELDAGALGQNCSILQLLVDQYPLKARRIVARVLADILHVTESRCRTGPG